MKTNLFTLAAAVFNRIPTLAATALVLGSLLLVQRPLAAGAAEPQVLPGQVPAAAANAPWVRRTAPTERLNLSLGLPLRNRAALTNLLQQLYDPAGTNYHHFLTPDEFAQNFGPTEADYEAVVRYAQSHGLTVTGRHSNRVVVGVQGAVTDIERAFHVRLNEYQHPTEARTFRAPDADPSLDLAVPVLTVSGLDNFVLPHPCLRPLTSSQTKPDLTGSGPNGAYLGNDFRAAYVPGAAQMGTGQTVGLLEFESGFFQNDITAYETLANLPNVPVTAVLLDGWNGGAGIGNDEVSLDIEMAISLAPGLKGVLVYEGETTDGILNRMATDNQARQIGASWTYSIDATSDQIFLQFAAQGQTFFNASGDSDAYSGATPPPTDDPNITIVGGTTLTTTGPGGPWVSETVWNWGGGVGGGGGISTTVPIPAWQKGISMTANQGSTTLRNLPDVAMTADNVYVMYGDGQAGAFGGTSCATPLWAAFTALVNELALTNGEPAMGFINPAIYAIGKGSNAVSYTALFHDTTTGNNESPTSPSRFSAVPGYDLCTGWGTPTGSNLISALALPEPLQITPATGVLFTGPVGGPFGPATQTFTLTNKAGGPLNWSLASLTTSFNFSPTGGTLTNGGPAAQVTVSLPAADTNLAPGSYTSPVWFSDLNDNYAQPRSVTLAVVTPPVITSQPTNEALLVGMTASFSVGIGPNALMYYQWQHAGTNLTDGGNISGSATATLTISDVTTTNAGAYAVLLNNAAGGLTSSNALLTIVPSPPVIVQQPTNQTVLPGAPATFSVTVVGNTPCFYHWQANGTNLHNGLTFGGVTNSTLTVSNASPALALTYSVTISNTLGQVTSTGAVLSLIPITPPNVAFSSLHNFTNNNDDGIAFGPPAQGRDGNFYGVSGEDGADGAGTVFLAATNGVLTTLYSFNVTKGAIPVGGLDLGRDGYFYGACATGGAYEDGTAFRVSPVGGFTLLATFNVNNGMDPLAGLVQGVDGSFYGMTELGGDYGYGTVYRVTSAGFMSTLVSLDGTVGAYGVSPLVRGADGNLYGTCEEGGTAGGAGTVFKMTPGGQFTVLYGFTGQADGAFPLAGLVQGADGNFYGTTYEGGANNVGTVFKITPAGTLTTLYSFGSADDGEYPEAALIQAADGNLYGTTQGGGVYGFGTVFRISPTGDYLSLVQFDNYIGASPNAGLVQGADGNLYGLTPGGGSAGGGTFYQLSISGPLQITGQPAGQEVYDGGTAVFSVATTGGAPVFYQWQQDGVNLTNGGNFSGVNAANLVITNVSFGDAAVYSVVVSNASNSVASSPAFLDVIVGPPNITAQPVSQTCIAGATVRFSVGAAGDLPLTYQWQQNGANLTDGGGLSGSATSTLTLTGVTATDAGTYSVVVGNGLFAVSSASATLTVTNATLPYAALTSLHFFTDGTDGAFPYANLIQAKDGNLYGTAEGGGTNYQGIVFRAPLSGGLTTLYNFVYGSVSGGVDPYGGLVQGTNGSFYGTTYEGGTNGAGTLYKVTTSGVATFFHSFTDGTDGAFPEAGMTQGADHNFYGTALEGGTYAYGCIYKLSPAGVFTNLYAFTGGTDGAFPYAGLIQGRDGGFYGTAVEGGPNEYGTVFRLATNGTLTTLAAFNYTDGGFPEAGVIQGADGRFYGTTLEGGTYGYGTVFALAVNGTTGTLTTLCSFSNTNGASPVSALVQGSDGNLYGATAAGGLGGQGTLFKITTNGVLTTLVWFDGFNGASPEASLIQANNGSFYGTTALGGIGYNPSVGGGDGTLFQLTVPCFTTNYFPAATAIACLPYSANLPARYVAPAGDPLVFALVSGPAWLNLTTNGLLSGTPTNANIGTNLFVVSLTDTNGVSAVATLAIVVAPDPAPVFLSNPVVVPWANVDEVYGANIATNATAEYLSAGDVLSFARVSGPAWLTVAPDGTLSGTPEGINGGTNIFELSVTDLGGSSNVTTLVVYVNSAPMFASPVFSEPVATVGVPYAATLATNATDPDLGAGDVLSFYKVTGPAWLDVATNGVLSGTPDSGSLGVDSFLMLVVDSGGLAAIGTMEITVNTAAAPGIIVNPLLGPPAQAGQPYALVLATNVVDPNFGDVLTFAKVSGPGWLNVNGNGGLTGIPQRANSGTNSFVVSVTDLTGLSTNALVYIQVSVAPLSGTLTTQNGSLVLGWTGGVAPYQVQATTNLVNPAWQNVGGPTSGTNMILTPGIGGAFYRIQGQ